MSKRIQLVEVTLAMVAIGCSSPAKDGGREQQFLGVVRSAGRGIDAQRVPSKDRPRAVSSTWRCGTVTRKCLVRVVPLRAETRVKYMHMRSPSEIVPTRRRVGHAV